MTPGAPPAGAPAAPAAPSAPDDAAIDKLKRFTADPSVPEDAKREAVAAFARTYPSTAPAQPPQAPATGEGELRATPTRGVIRGMLPERGPLGFLADVVTDPTEVLGTAGAMGGLAVGTAAAAALAPVTGGASALILPAFFAGLGGFGGREAGALIEGPAGETVSPFSGRGRQRSSFERWVGLAVDALPVAVGNALRPIVMAPKEIEAAVDVFTAARARGARTFEAGAKELAEERVAAVPKPATEALPPKPGRAPTTGKAAAPEMVGDVPVGAMRPISSGPSAPGTPPSVGPRFTRVATDHLGDVEEQAAARYSAAAASAKRANLREPVPPHIIDSATETIEALDRSGLDPTTRDGARKLLESIRDVGEDKVTKTSKGAIPGEVVEDIRPGITEVDFEVLDSWRQKLQEYAQPFSALGKPQSFTKGSIGHLLGLVKDEMKKLVRGTSAETMLDDADTFFVHEVQPARKIAQSVLRGEVEPNAFVDVFTNKKNEAKFVRYMAQLDRRNPGTATAFRRAKAQNMIERAMRGEEFNPQAFIDELETMPKGTRKALLEGTGPNEIRELASNIEQAKGFARAARADEKAITDKVYADAKAAHDAAVVDYAAAVQRARQAKADYRTAVEHAKAQPPELVAAKRKLAAQKMILSSPVAVGIGVAAMKALTAGNVYPLFAWLGGGYGGAQAAHGLSLLMSSPKAVPVVNALFRAAASGASPNRIVRLGNQLLWHFTEGAGRMAMRPDAPLPAVPEADEQLAE